MAEQVLLVEDNERSRRLAAAVLEMGGMSVTAAGTGHEAIAMARAARFDAVLLDIQLPDIDGVAVLRALRSEPEHDGLVLIACTAFAMRGDRERFLGEGFDGYLTKPLDVSTLADDIRTIMGSRTPSDGGRGR